MNITLQYIIIGVIFIGLPILAIWNYYDVQKYELARGGKYMQLVKYFNILHLHTLGDGWDEFINGYCDGDFDDVPSYLAFLEDEKRRKLADDKIKKEVE